MNFIKTPTPPYQQQDSAQARPRPTGVLGWLSGLLRTPTPAYKTAPPPTPPPPHAKADQADADADAE